MLSGEITAEPNAFGIVTLLPTVCLEIKYPSAEYHSPVSNESIYFSSVRRSLYIIAAWGLPT